MLPRILVIDDEKNIRRTLGLVLEGEGYEVIGFGTAEEGLKHLESDGADLVILDVKLPGMNGVEALGRIREGAAETREVPVIVISGHASLAEAVDAVRRGATDFFEKPLDRDAILIRVANCLAQRRLVREVSELRAVVDERREMLGQSPVMTRLRLEVAKVAPTRSRVLITGESGTGKELVAWAIHQASPRASGPFVKVNCAAIPSELIESELFGYERGAFTGAHGRKAGQFELADGGTLFLDEIGDMSLGAQAKVLRVLQSGELTRVGGERQVTIDVRVLAATNRNLEEAVRSGAFREDLFFRLNVVPIHAPPLRDRPGDVPILVRSFLARYCRENGLREKPLDDEVLTRLVAHDWPGNVRELRNVVERLVIMSSDRIRVEDLPTGLAQQAIPAATLVHNPALSPTGGERPTLRDFRDLVERQYIQAVLDENDWNISRTSQILGVERTNLHKKIRQLGLNRATG